MSDKFEHRGGCIFIKPSDALEALQHNLGGDFDRQHAEQLARKKSLARGEHALYVMAIIALGSTARCRECLRVGFKNTGVPPQIV